MTEADYGARADQAFVSSWCEYEAEHANTYDEGYKPRRAYFVDDYLVVTITDLGRRVYVTCFHEHFDRPHGVEPPRAATVGMRRLRYRQALDWDERGGMIRKVRRVRGV